MGIFVDDLLTRQQAWQRTGSAEYHLRGLDGALAILWVCHHKNAGDPIVTPELEEFIKACTPGIQTEHSWDGRTHCSDCGERYKWENTATCVECQKTLCWRCASHSMSRLGPKIISLRPRCGGEMY
jgi:hypothetical protein